MFNVAFVQSEMVVQLLNLREQARNVANMEIAAKEIDEAVKYVITLSHFDFRFESFSLLRPGGFRATTLCYSRRRDSGGWKKGNTPHANGSPGSSGSSRRSRNRALNFNLFLIALPLQLAIPCPPTLPCFPPLCTLLSSRYPVILMLPCYPHVSLRSSCCPREPLFSHIPC